jgi:RimJ/RimL family protein N-acetyltransferase
MRDWSLAKGDPLSLFLAADSRLSIPDYLNDHSWELLLGGGEPATLAELRDRYASWVRGSGSDTELWLNWIVRNVADGSAVGALQATVENPDTSPKALVAWTIGSAWQRQGYASEATIGLMQWLAQQGIQSVVAHIHPDHVASAKVAASAGLRPTGDSVDGEILWRLPESDHQSV